MKTPDDAKINNIESSSFKSILRNKMSDEQDIYEHLSEEDGGGYCILFLPDGSMYKVGIGHWGFNTHDIPLVDGCMEPKYYGKYKSLEIEVPIDEDAFSAFLKGFFDLGECDRVVCISDLANAIIAEYAAIRTKDEYETLIGYSLTHYDLRNPPGQWNMHDMMCNMRDAEPTDEEIADADRKHEEVLEQKAQYRDIVKQEIIKIENGKELCKCSKCGSDDLQITDDFASGILHFCKIQCKKCGNNVDSVCNPDKELAEIQAKAYWNLDNENNNN